MCANMKDNIKDERIKVGTRVLVIACYSTNELTKELKKQFVGYTAKVRVANGTFQAFPYSLDFDDEEKRKANHWHWRPSEIMYLEDQDYVKRKD